MLWDWLFRLAKRYLLWVLEAKELGIVIISIIAATTFIVQLLGPQLVKWSVVQSKEAFRDVSRKEVMQSLHVKDALQDTFAFITAGTPLRKIIDIVEERGMYNFVVVDKEKHLMGMFSITELKDALLEEELRQMIVAEDTAVRPDFILVPENPVAKALDYLNKRKANFLPVVNDLTSRQVVGIVEQQKLNETIDRKFLERRGNL